jgi:hypothetical protein
MPEQARALYFRSQARKITGAEEKSRQDLLEAINLLASHARHGNKESHGSAAERGEFDRQELDESIAFWSL